MNRLATESSPYLRQHADNPVDWYPWGEEAFTAARDRDRPILLSIGYSTCHWCHVMAHESFEDPDLAHTLNDLFVSIKVDREERPDVDAVYMEALQAMTGSGGWPLTAFLTPDGRPFFTGTYFPPRSSPGRPSFRQVCEAVDDAWRSQRSDLLDQAAQITDHIKTSSVVGGGALPDAGLLDDTRDLLVAQHDTSFGGFGGAPKFPRSMSLDLLMRHHQRAPNPETLAVVTRSLDAMAAGGIHDHLGGGFARYSVDREWLVPHFEKMLPDQALLARVYLHAWQITGADRFRRTLDQTVAYVLRDLQHGSGGFHAAEDADSENVEGKFYVWSSEEIRQVLGPGADPILEWWGVTPGGNFEGTNILNRLHGDPVDPEPDVVSDARRRLLETRDTRIRPGLDDKVLTEWNALMLATLAEAGAATGNQVWLDAAVANGEFLLANLRRSDGRWMRSWQDDGHGGAARHLGLAADYAALLDGFTRLGEATGRSRWIEAARTVADQLLDLFWDHDHGGLFTTGHDAEKLLARTKDLLDTATPSANSQAALGLLRLAALTGEATYHDHAVEIIEVLSTIADEKPAAVAHLLAAVDLFVHGIDEVAIVGNEPAMVTAVQEQYLPGAVLAWGEPYPSPLWDDRRNGLAYVCRNFTCLAPVSTAEALIERLAPVQVHRSPVHPTRTDSAGE